VPRKKEFFFTLAFPPPNFVPVKLARSLKTGQIILPFLHFCKTRCIFHLYKYNIPTTVFDMFRPPSFAAQTVRFVSFSNYTLSNFS